MNEPEDVRLKWREQIERGWLQAQAGQIVKGEEVFLKAEERIRHRGSKRTDGISLHRTEKAETRFPDIS